MTSLEKRMAKLSGRMSHDAWLKLQKARQHPRFPDMLADLEKIDGSLNAEDIQRALHQFLSHGKK